MSTVTRRMRSTGWAGGVAASLALVLLTAPIAARDASPSPAAAGSRSSPVLATPDDAVRRYLQGVRDGDVSEILASSAVNPMAEQVDLASWVDRFKAWIPTEVPLPGTDALFVEVNRAQQAARLLGQTRMLIYGLLTDLDPDGGIVAPVDRAWAEALMGQLDASRLADLQIGEIAFPIPDKEHDERYVAAMNRMAEVYGANEATERVALIGLDGRSWLVGFTLLRFGDEWRVASQSSPLSGLSASGAPSPFPGD